MKVSIIIVNYNTESLLLGALRSVIDKTCDVDFEIIVVDNRSKEDSLNLLKAQYPDVQYLFLDKNLGFGQANNEASRLASGEYLFFLNPDTILLNNAVKILSSCLDTYPNAGICGGNLYRADMSKNSSYYDLDFLTLEYRIIFNRKRTLGFNETGAIKEVKTIVGADLMIRKDVFDKLDGFDSDFFMYFEEVELCARVQQLGMKIMSVPQAEIIHLQGGSAENKTEELQHWSIKEHWYSKFVYFSKTHKSATVKLVYFLHLSKLWMAILFYSLTVDRAKKEYWKAKKAVLRDTWSRYTAYLTPK